MVFGCPHPGEEGVLSSSSNKTSACGFFGTSDTIQYSSNNQQICLFLSDLMSLLTRTEASKGLTKYGVHTLIFMEFEDISNI